MSNFIKSKHDQNIFDDFSSRQVSEKKLNFVNFYKIIEIK